MSDSDSEPDLKQPEPEKVVESPKEDETEQADAPKDADTEAAADTEEAATTKPQTVAQDSSDSDSDNDAAPKKSDGGAAEKKLQTEKEDLFGSDSDSDSGNEKDAAKPIKKEKEELFGSDDDSDEEDGNKEGQEKPPALIKLELEAIPVNAEKPMFATKIGEKLRFVKMPNFLSMQQKPFDPTNYDDDYEDDIVDEVGRKRVKLKFANALRWRYKRDAAGNDMKDDNDNYIRESNARYVKWSDGTEGLVLGENIVDCKIKDMSQEHNCLFQMKDQGLDACNVFDERLILKPATLDSDFHRDLTMEVAKYAGDRTKLKMTAPIEDPEKAVDDRHKKAKDAERKQTKIDAEKRRKKEEMNQSRPMNRENLEAGASASEADSDSDDDGGRRRSSSKYSDDDAEEQHSSDNASSADEKSPSKSKKQAKRSRIDEDSEDEDSEPESPKKTKRAKQISDSESD